MKLKEWKLEDNINTPTELVGYMQAVIEEYRESFNNKHDNPDKAFEFFIIACKDCVNIAKKKLWVD